VVGPVQNVGGQDAQSVDRDIVSHVKAQIAIKDYETSVVVDWFGFIPYANPHGQEAVVYRYDRNFITVIEAALESRRLY